MKMNRGESTWTKRRRMSEDFVRFFDWLLFLSVLSLSLDFYRGQVGDFCNLVALGG